MTIDENNPPPLQPQSMDHWERGLDPWHADAFVGTVAEGMFENGTERRWGWYAVDWCGNVIGWIADGTEVGLDEREGS